MRNLQRIYRYIGISLGILLTTFTLSAQKNAVKLGSGSRVQNCIVWGNTDCDRQVNVQALFSFIEGIQAGLPGFADVMSRDFLLRYDSPCRNAGSAEGITLPSFDLWGNRRLAGTAVDMGAHEYSSYKIFPAYSFANSFMIGAVWRHGPHQSAYRSMMAGLLPL